MSYDIGHHIDLSYINRKSKNTPKKSLSQAAGNFYSIGTKIIFTKFISIPPVALTISLA